MKKVLLVVNALLLAGCGKSTQQPIHVGALLATTGSLAQHGTEELDGVAFALEEINRQGGVLGGRLLELVHRDDNSDKAKGPGLAQEMIESYAVPAIIGPAGSAITLETIKTTQPLKVPLISPGASSPLLTTEPDDGYIFRTIPSDALQGRVLAQRAYAKGHRKVAILYVGNAYGIGLADTFETVFKAMGGTITFKSTYTEKQASYSSLLDSLYAAGAPDCVLAVAYQVDGASMVKDYLNRLSSNATFWFFSDSFYGQDFVTGVGTSSFASFQHEGVVPGAPADQRYSKFASDFQKANAREPTIYTAFGYDAAYLVALALQTAGQAQGEAVKDALTQVSRDGVALGASELKEALDVAAAGTDLNYVGVTGNVDFDSNGDVVGAYNIWAVNGSGALFTTATGVVPQ
jgi:branched-chain amino acid transport system substrate-binding protein